MPLAHHPFRLPARRRRRRRRHERRRLPLARLAVFAAVATATAAGPQAAHAGARPAPAAAPPDAPPVVVRYVPPVDAPVVDSFRPPTQPWSSGNRGLEYDTSRGDPVRASADGIVTFAGQVGGSLHVTVLHPDGLRTGYSFLSRVLVSQGQAVRQGDLVGRAGDTFHFGAAGRRRLRRPGGVVRHRGDGRRAAALRGAARRRPRPRRRGRPGLPAGSVRRHRHGSGPRPGLRLARRPHGGAGGCPARHPPHLPGDEPGPRPRRASRPARAVLGGRRPGPARAGRAPGGDHGRRPGLDELRRQHRRAAHPGARLRRR